jgi:hypothetical protein
MKALHWFTRVCCFVFLLVSIAGVSFAAPSLPITKPSVVGSFVTVHGYINRWHQEIQVFYLGKNKKSKKSHFFRDSHGIIVYLVS